MSTATSDNPHLRAITERVIRKLHLGAGKDRKEGWINLDMCALPGIDVVADLNECGTKPLPFAENVFEEIFANHVLEHIPNPLPLMQELHRIARNGALCLFNTPYGSSDDAFENPTHVRQYFLGSYGYFSQPFFWREDYGYRGDWQPEKLLLKIRKGMYTEMTNPRVILDDIMTKRNIVLEMSATLRCVKPIRAMNRDLQTAPKIEFALVDSR